MVRKGLHVTGEICVCVIRFMQEEKRMYFRMNGCYKGSLVTRLLLVSGDGDRV